MSYAESPTKTVIKFARTPGWQNASEETIAGDLFCISNETNLAWDQFVYEEKEGKLFDPLRGSIAGSANNDSVEEEVNTQLERWFFTHESGLAVWISPRGGETRPYPEEKITIYRIAYEFSGRKLLLGASHQFKADFKNPEEMRKLIFTEDDKEESIFKIIAWLKKVSEKAVATEAADQKNRREQAAYYAHQYTSGVPIEKITQKMRSSGFLGSNPISCSVRSTIFSSFFGQKDRFGPLEFSCPVCGLTNQRPAGTLLSNCRFCGAKINC